MHIADVLGFSDISLFIFCPHSILPNSSTKTSASHHHPDFSGLGGLQATKTPPVPPPDGQRPPFRHPFTLDLAPGPALPFAQPLTLPEGPGPASRSPYHCLLRFCRCEESRHSTASPSDTDPVLDPTEARSSTAARLFQKAMGARHVRRWPLGTLYIYLQDMYVCYSFPVLTCSL